MHPRLSRTSALRSMHSYQITVSIYRLHKTGVKLLTVQALVKTALDEKIDK